MAIQETLNKLASLPPGEYLLYIGAVYLALLLATRRRWISATAAFAIGLLWLSVYLSIAVYVYSLSADSFAEARHFDFEEARFWLLTLNEAIHAELSVKKLVLYSAAALGSFAFLWFVLRRLGRLSPRAWFAVKATIGAVLIGASLYDTTALAVAAYVENTEGYEVTARNFSQPVPAMAPAGRQLDLVVYVGESTSSMNMGLYGYPRDTTPNLSRLARSDPGLLAWRNVFSTHSHTSRSLLEALSFGLDAADEFLPIAKRKRVSAADVLGQAGVPGRVFSNQGQRGAWEQASTVIFRNAPTTYRVAQALDAARRGGPEPSRYDHAFFDAELNRDTAPGDRSRVTFLHSYGGHGPYLENIPPEFRGPVDDRFADLPPHQVLDDAGQSVALLEAYDSAVKYVDHSVSRMVDRVRQWHRPAVMVYFSDHGDAVFSNRGHDSARFRHEMVRVPLVVYFNERARAAYPALFAKYQVLARSGEIATLAQLPSTLLDLLDAKPRQAASLLVTPVVGERTMLPPILIRENTEGVITFVNLNAQPLAPRGPAGRQLAEREDDDTRTFVAVHSGRLSAAQVCTQPADTFEALSRRIMVAGCQPPAPTLSVAAPLRQATP